MIKYLIIIVYRHHFSSILTKKREMHTIFGSIRARKNTSRRFQVAISLRAQVRNVTIMTIVRDI